MYDVNNPTQYNVNYYNRVVLDAYPSFETCAEIARINNITGSDRWTNFAKSVNKGLTSANYNLNGLRLPHEPYIIYYWKWVSFPAFLSEDPDFIEDERQRILEAENKKWKLSFYELREYALSKKLPHSNAWRRHAIDYGKNKLPIRPLVWQKYKHQWEGWHHFLGIPLSELEPASVRTFKSFTLPYNEAKHFVRSLNLSKKTQTAFCNFRTENKILELPTNPHKVYSRDWISWDVFFGILNFDTLNIYVPSYTVNNTSYLYIAYYNKPGMHGIYDIGIENNTTSPIQNRLYKTGAIPLHFYKLNKDDRKFAVGIMKKYRVSTVEPNVFKMFNISQMVFELDQHFEKLPVSEIGYVTNYSLAPSVIVNLNNYYTDISKNNESSKHIILSNDINTQPTQQYFNNQNITQSTSWVLDI